MAMIVPHTVPNLLLTQRVIDKMTAAAKRYLADETGEAMVGVVIHDSQNKATPSVYILDTISPDDAGTPDATPVRQWGMFEQGDDLQGDIFLWLFENWEAQRAKRRESFGSALQAKWDAPLRHLGDWHKQPGYMIKPSFGDLLTALKMLDDEENGLEFLIAPIVTLGHPSTTRSDGAAVNYLCVAMGDGTDLRVDFWYIHRDVRVFQPLTPKIIPNDQVPSLCQYPWHMVRTDRFTAEINQLQGAGLFTSVVLWDTDNKIPLEVCFLTARRGAEKVIVFVTAWNYPTEAPKAYLAPFVQMSDDDDMYDVFEHVWAQALPVKNPDAWQWSAESYLVDYARVIEESLGIKSALEESSPEDKPVEQKADVDKD